MKVRTRVRNVLMSSDYSQQEPKLLTQLCGDPNMLESYRQGKDLYSQIAAIAFHKKYEECLEHFPNGTPIKQQGEYWYWSTEDACDKLADGETNHDGKELRSQAKKILLGIMYGRGERSIAEQLGCDVDEAKKIKEDVYTGFPAIKDFEDASLKMAHEKGYVTTLWGRKRRLPEINLPQYEFYKGDVKITNQNDAITLSNLSSIMNSAKTFYARNAAIKQIESMGYSVIDNGGKIANATRQVINSRVQGSAADMSKKAMVAVNTDDRLRSLGGKVIIPVHDELILQAPLRYSREVATRFANDMSHAADDKLTIPISCDVEISYEWYGQSLDLDEELAGLKD